jgi:gluconate 5-dehydrogenase
MNNLFSVHDKKVLVTGAAKGNGKAIAKGFAINGAELIIIDKSEENLELAYKEIKSCSVNSKVTKVCLDLSDANEVENFSSNCPPVDVLINNAGISKSNPLTSYSNKDWEDTYKVNIRAPFILTRALAKNMCSNRSGSIINVTSLAAEQGFPENVAYVAFKGALKQFTKSTALELAKYNVRVNSVGPGYFKTDMTKKSWSDLKLRQLRTDRIPLGRWGEPDDLIGVMIFLASSGSSYITGQAIYVDGGWLCKGL